ncbi:DMT family transporter [Pannus brasiliensis CCIBt3594]|uniref:DMT family transporter n=1 Tax=Pannus brasiliensis CCIBt3594 TaxID=1427578 RepID=A0AAW9QNL1_9CHRO
MPPSPLKIALVLAIGVLSVSTAAIFIRLASEAAGGGSIAFSLFLAASRMILASIVLLPNWFRNTSEKTTAKAYYLAIAAGFALACHFATWTASLSYTSIAASTTLVVTNPLWIALIGWWWFGEKPRRSTFLGIFLALSGGILVAFGPTDHNAAYPNPLLGNGLALGGAWMASFYILCGREARREELSVGRYVTLAYSTAALVLLPLPFLTGGNYLEYSPAVYTYVLWIALVPQSIGHTSFNWALRWVSPTVVSLVILFEPIGSSLLGVLIFREIPPASAIYGGFILSIGVISAIVGTRDKSQPYSDADHTE